MIVIQMIKITNFIKMIIIKENNIFSLQSKSLYPRHKNRSRDPKKKKM